MGDLDSLSPGLHRHRVYNGAAVGHQRPSRDPTGVTCSSERQEVAITSPGQRAILFFPWTCFSRSRFLLSCVFVQARS